MKSKLYNKKTIILIGGPTASGKSCLANNLAEELDGEIINADSMQVYKNFPILTSQPSEIDRKKIKHYDLRYFMKPGISGWAQVNYPYGASHKDAKNKLSYDLYYIRNFSNLLDFLILFKTIKIILHRQGAIASN